MTVYWPVEELRLLLFALMVKQNRRGHYLLKQGLENIVYFDFRNTLFKSRAPFNYKIEENDGIFLPA